MDNWTGQISSGIDNTYTSGQSAETQIGWIVRTMDFSKVWEPSPPTRLDKIKNIRFKIRNKIDSIIFKLGYERWK